MMDPTDSVPSGTFSEEDKLPDGMDEDANWFSKNLGDESDNTVEHDVGQDAIDSHINQVELGEDLNSVKDTDLIKSEESTKPADEVMEADEAMETDSQSELLAGISDEKHIDQKKDELTELKDIELNTKKLDINNELKEMFEEKSSDAEELHETSLSKHSLDTDITKEDKLKDIVPDDILGKDDSFDGLDNDVLHQELEAHLTYGKNVEEQELISNLPDHSEELGDESCVSHPQESEQESQNEVETESGMTKSLNELGFEGKNDLLNNLTENIGTKEIDEIMEEEIPTEEDSSNKDMPSELTDISKDLENSCMSELKEDLENQLTDITGEGKEGLKEEKENMETENVNPVDKANIELNGENMMVEFAHGSGNQVLIQINTDKPELTPETPVKSEGIVMETSDGQTLVFSSSEAAEPTTAENDVVSQVEGGAEFLQAVTGKLEDVLAPEPQEEKSPPPPEPAVTETQRVQPTSPPAAVEKKEPLKTTPPKCCVSTCKSGKSTMKTTYRFFKPPVNKILYKKWEYIFGQAKQVLTPESLICELHFRTGLIYKRGLDKFGKVVWGLREGALPKLSASGVLRVTGGMVPTPSTTVQVAKKQDSLVKSPATTSPNKPTSSLHETKSPSVNVSVTSTVSPSTPKMLGKKILQKPIKTVATKVSNEVTDIGFLYKNPELVKVAQEEIANLDVLVCGECHSVFHILELFQAHKMADNCKGESNFKGNPAEPKPQVWAFLLWKSAQAKVSDVESSWKLYQRWCKMDEEIRNAWIAAGKALQEGNTVASLKLYDSPLPKHNKVGRPPMKPRDSDDDDFHTRKPAKRPKTAGRPASSASVSEYDSSDVGGGGDFIPEPEPEPMEVENSHVSPAKPLEDAYDESQTMENLARSTPEMITADVEIKQEVLSDDEHDENKENNARKNVGAQKAPVTIPKQTTEKKSDPSNPEEEEFVVEKIVSRRYNIKKKHYEYLLKWEGYPSEQNTWEPAENLGTCQHLLKAFEEALAKQQAAKQQAAVRHSGVTIKQEQLSPKIKPPFVPNKKKLNTSISSPATPTTATGRPVRSSKQKAMDQVKQWCGSIVRPSDDDNVGLKRKLSESDSEYEEDEEVVVKRVKMEVESEDSDVDSFKRVSVGRGRGRPPMGGTPRAGANKVVNGENLAAALGLESDEEDLPVVRNMSSLSPSKQQVLVASAKGVVTVDQKQMPNLSSGVYIMSNKSGIVKVDNNKTLNTLQKSGMLQNLPGVKKEVNTSPATSPQKPTSGVVVLPRSEAGALQQKVGVIRKTSAPTTMTQTTTTTTAVPAKPSGLLRPGLSPRPPGLLRPTGSPPVRPQGQVTNTNAKVQPTLRPRMATPGRGRPPISPLVKRPLNEGLGLQASHQQKLLIAKKKAESEGGGETRPAVMVSPAPRLPLVKPKSEGGVPGLPPIRSTNKPLAHPLLSRGRGRGYRGRGRGSSLSQLLQVREREREPEPEPIKESRLVDSDNLLMEFQEPSESEESDDGLDDIFPNLEELPPIEPDSPPRPLSLCPETGKVLCKAEGEKTPEPTPPPSPKAPTPPPPPPPPPVVEEEPTHILPDQEDLEPEVEEAPVPVAVTPAPRLTPTTTTSSTTTTTTVLPKQESMVCKVEMLPAGGTGAMVQTVSAAAAPQGVTEGTVTIKKPLASRNRNINRGPQLSVVSNTSSTSLGTITVPARKLFQEENVEDNMVTIAGEDGLVYQVSNSELAGNTLLVSSGEDGEQQCVYVTTGEDGSDTSTILTLDSAYANAVAQLGTDQVNILSTEDGDQYFIKEGDGDEVMTLEGEEGLIAGDDQSGQVVAQLVEAGEPAPGGSRRVVLLLPDGNLMMTEVDEEQYAALDLDK